MKLNWSRIDQNGFMSTILDNRNKNWPKFSKIDRIRYKFNQIEFIFAPILTYFWVIFDFLSLKANLTSFKPSDDLRTWSKSCLNCRVNSKMVWNVEIGAIGPKLSTFGILWRKNREMTATRAFRTRWRGHIWRNFVSYLHFRQKFIISNRILKFKHELKFSLSSL